MNYSTLSPESETCSRSPAISSTAFHAQPPDLRFASLIDMGIATIGQLARTLPASYPVLVHRLASLLRASFRPRLAAGVISPLRFAITSPPSGCEEDLHLQAVDHARHIKKKAGLKLRPAFSLAIAKRSTEFNPGGDLRSHTVARAVSSAQRGLTTVFGMGTGVTLAVLPPETFARCGDPVY